MATDTKNQLKRKSHVVTDGPDRAPARSMLRAVGLNDDDMNKPFVAIGNLASDVTPCNVHLDRLARKVKEGVRAADSVPFMFGTITISDGISMGTEGMKASLVSREVIADSIETITFGESMDGLIVVAACDKNMPGAMMAMARLNVPAVFVYDTFVPSFGSAWGFVIGSLGPDPAALTAEEVDRRVTQRVTAGLRHYDGTTHRGMFSVPKYLRAALDAEKRIITNANPLFVT